MKTHVTSKLRLTFFFICIALAAEAKVKLPTLIADGMVIQREQPVKLWGSADPGEKVIITFNKKRYETTADEKGAWEVTTNPMKAGGPYTMSVNDITLKDILVGDVFLCSGQSNMELMVSRVMDKYADEVKAYENPMIRYIKVPYAYDYNAPQADIRPAKWNALTQEHVMNYSAICYFFAKLLYEKTKVPVGLINSSWGGTPVEAWISEEGLKDFPAYVHQKAMYESKELVRQIQQTEGRHSQAWRNELYRSDIGLHEATPWYAADYDDSKWEETDMFSPEWATDGWRPVNGSHWFRRTVEIPESWKGKDAVLRLGCMVDADSVFVNGSFVGTISYQYPPRIYKVPARLLRPGTNQITIRLISNAGYPSFVREKPYKLICGNEEVSLEGNWKHRVGTRMPSAPGGTAFNCMPIGLYNGMIAPLKNCVFKGAVWYQGESNVSRWQEYASLLTAMMKDWRRLFGNEALPFYIVELADFLAPDDPGRKAWAALRSQQAKAADEDPHATLIKNSDTGEWNDIHPLDKKTAAGRIVEAVTSAH